jgi:hypothetical protein
METPKHYICYRANAPLPLTGSLESEFWKQALWTEDFVDIEGAIRPAPAYRTRVKMLWDDDYLYIGAEMQEPHVWATLTEHDAVIFQDNDFEVFIDPDGDNHNYYEIEINALNTTRDLRLVKPNRDGGPALNEWEIPGFRSAIAIDGTLNDASDEDRGWSVEMAIPWQALGEFAHCPSPPCDGHQWRINFSRVEWDIEVVEGRYRKIPERPEHNWVWSPQGVIDMHQPERWGIVQFSTAAPGTARYFPDPALPARERLMRVYHRQRAFQTEHGRWAATLSELDADLPPSISLEMTPEGYTAHCDVGLPDGTTVRWHVRQDSRLWRDL